MNSRPQPRQARKSRVLRVLPLLHEFPFSLFPLCSPFFTGHETRSTDHDLSPNFHFRFSIFRLSHFPYTLPSSVSRNPFICHSYANRRGVGVFFPFWSTRSAAAWNSSLATQAVGVLKPFVYHTCRKLPRNSFPCHTSKIAGLKVLCLPHIQHPRGVLAFC